MTEFTAVTHHKAYTALRANQEYIAFDVEGVRSELAIAIEKLSETLPKNRPAELLWLMSRILESKGVFRPEIFQQYVDEASQGGKALAKEEVVVYALALFLSRGVRLVPNEPYEHPPE